MTKINILVIPPDIFAVGKFRITDPYIHLQENYGDDFHVDIKHEVPDNDSEFFKYDIVVAHSFIHNKISNEGNLKRIESLKKQGKIVIIDIDDYWEPDFRHPMHTQIQRNNIGKKKIELMKSANYVTTTTPVFRNVIMKRTGLKNVIVFPNAINDKEPQFIPNPTTSNLIRFGWLGGSSHMHDIELIKSGVSNIIDYANNKVQFILCGFDLRGSVTEINKQTGESKTRDILPEETVWTSYEKVFTNNYKSLDSDYSNFLKKYINFPYNDLDKPYRRRWTVDISKYAMNYNTFDVALSPLIDNIFNNCKSQLKAIESGFHKKALIASGCNPYSIDLVNAVEFGGGYNSKGNALLVDPAKNHKQWAQHMKRLIDNPNLINDLGNKLHETVSVKYSLDKVNKDRSEFLKSIVQ